MQEQQKRNYEPGTLVAFTNKTGRYAGELMEINGARALVKTLAVLKHPEQGDLHNPYNPDVAMFHERRALSYTEKTNVLLGDIEPFHGDVPDYKESRARALAVEIESLDRLKRWAERGIDALRTLEKEY
ncbi:sporulation phosphorelay system protein KapB [Paenibacillus sacheonensis]|uniref:Kinase n=1 Tax=Paenibacillus sacheonensis TaxID=742054 RepID=A0A7X4YUQ4_9BACL|nr:sporulation phosphorelay system protein KapB [Paenibacillus sacheonensis]NBC72808.1 kinase [Paenibacillus sacheonensis]